MKRLWDKGVPLDDKVLAFTAGEDHALDERLVRYDIEASVAHVTMLAAQNLIPHADLPRIVSALRKIGEEHAAGHWHVELADEDGQTALEKRLTAAIGEAGGRVHLGRSRNDQVLTALRLYLRDAVNQLTDAAQRVCDALERLVERQGDVALPGYTHLQQAMPSSVALWAGGFRSEIADDIAGLAATQRRIGRNPLGSAAGFGTPGLPLDRHATTQALGFAEVQTPVTAVQLSRGKAEASVLFELTLLSQDISRLCADLLLFYTQEFGYVDLPDAFTTGSSIMPQKRNPDVFELVRGRSATALGCLIEALGVSSKLTSGYHRDLQLLKAPLFRGIDTSLMCLDILPAALDALKFKPQNIRLDPGVYAAEQAYALVTRDGIPFREAYRRVAADLAAKDHGKPKA